MSRFIFWFLPLGNMRFKEDYVGLYPRIQALISTELPEAWGKAIDTLWQQS